MTAGGLLILLAGKLTIAGALFTVLVSFGLWLGRVGFMTQRESDAVSG